MRVAEAAADRPGCGLRVLEGTAGAQSGRYGHSSASVWPSARGLDSAQWAVRAKVVSGYQVWTLSACAACETLR
jgi:hypothetical protein